MFVIDTKMHGIPGITAVFYLPGPHPVLIETGPTSSLEHTLAGLEQVGVDRLEAIIVTHVHLDHAGAVGHLAERFPDAQIIVRVEGAPHLVNPGRLWAAASRVFPNMLETWGEMKPVPAERILAVESDSTVFELGDGRRLDAIHTPGHANHHMALLERKEGELYAGDAIGVILPEARVAWPATPPTEFDLQLAIKSIEKLRAIKPSRLLPTHFGEVIDPVATLNDAIARLQQWFGAAEPVVASGGGTQEVAEEFRRLAEELYPTLSNETLQKLDKTMPFALNAAGIVRYLSKRISSPT